MKFKLYESPKSTSTLMVLERGPMIGEYSTMDEVNAKIEFIAKSQPGMLKFDSEELPIIPRVNEAAYFIHTRVFKEEKIDTMVHILIIEK